MRFLEVSQKISFSHNISVPFSLIFMIDYHTSLIFMKITECVKTLRKNSALKPLLWSYNGDIIIKKNSTIALAIKMDKN